jgi:hypothetical protein
MLNHQSLEPLSLHGNSRHCFLLSSLLTSIPECEVSSPEGLHIKCACLPYPVSYQNVVSLIVCISIRNTYMHTNILFLNPSLFAICTKYNKQMVWFIDRDGGEERSVALFCIQ